KTSSSSRLALILSELASSPSRAASRPPQDEDAARRRALAPQDEEVLGDLILEVRGRPSSPLSLILRCARPSTTAVLILRCEGEARASKERTLGRSRIRARASKGEAATQ